MGKHHAISHFKGGVPYLYNDNVWHKFAGYSFFISIEKNDIKNKTTVTSEMESVRNPKDSSETLNLLGWEDKEIGLLYYWANKDREKKKKKYKTKIFQCESCLKSEKNQITFKYYSCHYGCERKDNLKKHMNTKHIGFVKADHREGDSSL